MADPPKRIAVVCYGWPTNNTHVAGYDHVIAVNRAGGTVFAEYQVCADYEAVDTFVPLNAETVFVADTRNATKIREIHHLPKWRTVCADAPGELTASIFIAIWFASTYLHAREIDVFGARWSGQKDADGYKDEHMRRTSVRWTKEKRIFDDLQKKLAGRGIVLRRLLREDVTDG